MISSTKALLAASIICRSDAAPIMEKAGTINGFFYAPYATGGNGGSTCAPKTANLEYAPDSSNHELAAFFYGLTPTQWCGATGLGYLNDDLKFPGNFEDITNSFSGSSSSFNDKMFTLGGGTMTWTKSMIEKLDSGCESSTDKGLVEKVKDAGYNGIIIDWEYEATGAQGALKTFIQNFDTNHPNMKLAFTTLGNTGASTAVASLLTTLKATTEWHYLIPQLYDDNSCIYTSELLGVADTAYDGFSSSKVLLGLPQGVSISDSDFPADKKSTDGQGIKNTGTVEWLYRVNGMTK